MSKRVWLAALALVAVTSGCGPGSEPESEPKPAAEDVVQTIDPSKATTLKLGDTLEVVAELPRTFDGDPVYFSAFAGDGVLVGRVTPKDEATALAAGGPLQQSHPVMYDLETKAFTLLDDRARPEPTQVVGVSGNDKAVVWAELVGTNVDTSEFTFYSYDRRTKQVATIGEFADPAGQIVYGNDLDIAGDFAYFSTPAYPKKRGQEAVYAVPVDGSKPPSVIAAGGVHVKLTDDSLSYQVPDPHDKDASPSFFTYDLRTRETTPVAVSAHVDEPGFCGAEVTEDWETWCVGRVSRDEDQQPALLTIKESSGRTTQFKPFPTGSLNSPIPHDVITLGPWTAVTVTTDGGQDRKFLIDLDTKKVKAFPDNTSFDALSPDRSMVLVSSYASKGPGPQRIVKIPTT